MGNGRAFGRMLGMVLVLGVALAACGSGTAANRATVQLSSDLFDMGFAPATSSVPAGSEVAITLSNSGTVEHEWVLMEAGYQATIPFDEDDESHVYWEAEVDAGETRTFTFTAPTTSGEYQVICGLRGHAESGMIGTLTVTP